MSDALLTHAEVLCICQQYVRYTRYLIDKLAHWQASRPAQLRWFMSDYQLLPEVNLMMQETKSRLFRHTICEQRKPNFARAVYKSTFYYLMSVLNACAIVGRLTEVNGVVYWTRALLRICNQHTKQSVSRWNEKMTVLSSIQGHHRGPSRQNPASYLPSHQGNASMPSCASRLVQAGFVQFVASGSNCVCQMGCQCGEWIKGQASREISQ